MRSILMVKVSAWGGQILGMQWWVIDFWFNSFQYSLIYTKMNIWNMHSWLLMWRVMSHLITKILWQWSKFEYKYDQISHYETNWFNPPAYEPGKMIEVTVQFKMILFMACSHVHKTWNYYNEDNNYYTTMIMCIKINNHRKKNIYLCI